MVYMHNYACYEKNSKHIQRNANSTVEKFYLWTLSDKHAEMCIKNSIFHIFNA